MSTQTLVKINLGTKTTSDQDGSWKTILFNCNCHTFETVIEQIVKAIGCSTATASQLANVADKFGKATIFEGSKGKCEKAADILGSAGLLVKVEQ